MSEDRNHEERDTVAGTVVVGVDGSEASSAAVEWAARTASAYGRDLLIVHSVDPGSGRMPIDTYDVLVTPLNESLRDRGAEYLARAESRARESAPGLAVSTELVEDSPARRLIILSDRAHLIVLGATPGAGTLAHLGSTLTAVCAHARGSVVVARGVPVDDSAPVVVGVDGSAVGEAAIGAAFAEAAIRGVELIAVHAWSDLSEATFAGLAYRDLPIEDIESAERALLAERLAGWQEKYPEVTVTRKVLLTDLRNRLGDWSKTAQLIVVGSRGRGGFQGLLLGSTSNWLVQHAECPVMIVHPR